MDQNQNVVVGTVLPLVIFNMLCKPKYPKIPVLQIGKERHTKI